ncbi:hypothetical protein [Streptomyces rhizosphaericus]|uniref:hypothetical protein n=1 Tax=Streptomyces rhizosphaericus TaxID=114699 RepID=UPI00117E5C6A|nr:hypothetical protein [Streptomyces rhizosphaericus]
MFDAATQARVDHAQSLREERRTAYLVFQEAVEPIYDALRRLGFAEGVNGPTFTLLSAQFAIRRSGRETSLAVHELSKALVQIQLVGPEDVIGPAHEVRYAARDLNEVLDEFIRHLMRLRGGDADVIYEAMRRLDSRRAEFSSAVRRVMETPP